MGTAGWRVEAAGRCADYLTLHRAWVVRRVAGAACAQDQLMDLGPVFSAVAAQYGTTPNAHYDVGDARGTLGCVLPGWGLWEGENDNRTQGDTVLR